MLADRIAKNGRHLRKWGKRNGFSCLRLYDHDIPEFALSVDDYEGRVLATLSSAATERHSEEELRAEIQAALQPDVVVFKLRGRRPGGTATTASELDPGTGFVVHERDLKFEVNLHGHQDTGLFLDHRLTRVWVRERARGLDVLNLFCYTGSFSVAAGVGGASAVTSIDLSNTYLDWADRNWTLNELPPRNHRLLQADVLQWLPAARDAGETYGLIICDPPTFSNSKRMTQTFDLQELHLPMLVALQRMLVPGGTLLFSCNDSSFKLDASLPLTETTERTRSEDFRRGRGHRSWQWTAP